MKLPRRAAAGIAAFLMAVSLLAVPVTSGAHFVDGPLNNPPPREGDPDVPYGFMYQWGINVLVGRLIPIRIGLAVPVYVFVPNLRVR